MSERFPGGIISKTAPVPTGPYENGTAPGVWTLEQQAEFVKQGIWPIAGNVPNYIEDVFQTWLYTGNGSTQTITNGIDLSGKGGLTWVKRRTGAGWYNNLLDTTRGATSVLYSNTTDAAASIGSGEFTFNSNGFSLATADGNFNSATGTYASWTFREQSKFFDVVTYVGNEVSGRQISHNLGAVPGCIIVKAVDRVDNWGVYHRSQGATKYGNLQNTDPFNPSSAYWNNTEPTSTVFTIGNQGAVNNNGTTYVAYLFAHNAGGFGLSGTDNVISCGSYTGNGSTTGPSVTLGYEPQWVLIKRASGGTQNWIITDNMRDFSLNGNARLFPNLADAESAVAGIVQPNATGFSINGTTGSEYNASGNTYIYIAIRRGPMKVPTTGTSVYQGITYTGNGASSRTFTPGITVDLTLVADRADPDGFGGTKALLSRLTGTGFMSTFNGNAQDNNPTFATNVSGSVTLGNLGSDPFGNRYWNSTYDLSYINYLFSRAPSVFDVVCYTGNGTAGRTITHNLTVAPELLIARQRTGGDWYVYSSGTTATKYLVLNSTAAEATDSSLWNNTAPTSSVFTVGDATGVNRSNAPFVAFLFASCPGVSKVGSFTGTGATQVINCGFTGGARFVLIKATSTTGNWLVWDSARGIVAGNDPYLALNITGAEVTNTDWVDTAASGFELSNAGGNLVNSNGVSYIFLAIA